MRRIKIRMRTQVGEEKWRNMKGMKDENKEDNKKKKNGRRELDEDVIR
jgi:hypothetical protein